MSSFHVQSTRQGFILIRDNISGRSGLFTHDGKRCQGALVLSRYEVLRLVNRLN